MKKNEEESYSAELAEVEWRVSFLAKEADTFFADIRNDKNAEYSV